MGTKSGERKPKRHTGIRRQTATGLPADYPLLLAGIKQRIRTAQIRATLSANRELINLYWDIGRVIAERQEQEGWGAAVIPRLARDIRNELPEVKGFSERNIGYMVRFAREYPLDLFLQQAAAKTSPPEKRRSADARSSRSALSTQPVAQLIRADILPILQRLVAQLPWFHHIILMEKVKDLSTLVWYMR